MEAAFDEFRECLEASVYADPPISEEEFHEASRQLAEITLATAPSLLPRLEAENERILELLRVRSHDWCARILAEELARTDLSSAAGGEAAAETFAQRLAAVLRRYKERASGPGFDATLVSFCCGGELLRLFGIFDGNVLAAQRREHAARACEREQVSLRATFAREQEKLRCSLEQERATLERLQGVTLGRTKAGGKELEDSQLQLADLDNQLVALQGERDATAATTAEAELELQRLTAQLKAVRADLDAAAEQGSQETVDLEAATTELQQIEEVWSREQNQLNGAVADATAVAQASVTTLQKKLDLAAEEKREVQERLVELTLKLAELPTSFQGTALCKLATFFATPTA